jgi:hypothetical protein
LFRQYGRRQVGYLMSHTESDFLLSVGQAFLIATNNLTQDGLTVKYQLE